MANISAKDFFGEEQGKPISAGDFFGDTAGQPDSYGNVPITQETNAAQKVVDFTGNLSEGFAKGILSTVQGLGQATLKGLQATGRGVVAPFEAMTGKKFNQPSFATNETFTADPTALEAKNTPQKIGKFVEQAAEFFIPGGNVARGQKALDIALNGSGLIKTAGRVAGKATVEGLGAGGVTLAQTGGDVKEAGQTALTAGVFKGVTGTVGETLKAFKVPEKLYSRIFKTTTDDALAELKSSAIANLKQTNPQNYQQLVSNGIIKEGANGPIVNETLAREAIDRGLKGSIDTMATKVVQDTLNLEAKAQSLAKNYAKPLVIQPQYKSVLAEVADEYKNVGFGEFSDEAKQLASRIGDDGSISAQDALQLRRLLDGLRRASSFNPSAKLSTSQMNFKILSDKLRGKLAEIPEFAKTMNDYRFNIEALDSIAKESARQGNRRVLGMVDTTLVGGGLISGQTLPATSLAVLRKIWTSTVGSTHAAQMIENSGALSPVGSFLKGTVYGGINLKDQ